MVFALAAQSTILAFQNPVALSEKISSAGLTPYALSHRIAFSHFAEPQLLNEKLLRRF